jgi:hypothetical protein
MIFSTGSNVSRAPAHRLRALIVRPLHNVRNGSYQTYPERSTKYPQQILDLRPYHAIGG